MSRSVKSSKGLLTRGRELIIANMWLLWIAILVSIFLSISTSQKMYRLAEETSKRIESSADKISKGVILLDMLGRPVISQPVEANSANPAFKVAILGYIRLYGIYDWATLTDNYAYRVYSIEELFSRNKRVKMFRKEFFEEGSAGQKDFDAYLTKMITLMNRNKLPESVSIVSEKITAFEVKGDKFSITVDFTVQSREYDPNTDDVQLRGGHILVRATGKMDPSVGTPANPLGIVFSEQYEPSIIEKKVGSI